MGVGWSGVTRQRNTVFRDTHKHFQVLRVRRSPKIPEGPRVPGHSSADVSGFATCG